MTGLSAVTAATGGDAAADEANDPGSEALESDENFAVAGDDGFSFAAGDGAENLADGGGCGHDEPFGDGLLGIVMERALIVDAADVGRDETGTDERDVHAFEGEFRGDGVGEGADGKFAHPVSRSSGGSGPTSDAADEDQRAVRLPDFRECGVERANQAEDVGFELAAVIFDGETGEGADNAEAGIGDDDVEFAISTDSFRDGVLEVAIAGDVSRGDEGSFVAGGRDFLGERVEEFAAAGG